MSAERGTILVVEDEPILRMVLSDHLADLGYRTIEAEDGNAALPVLEGDTALALVITDVDMPGMDGRALAEAARRLRPALGIVFSTGDTGAIRDWAGFDAAIMQAVSKPFQADELAAAIDRFAPKPSAG